MGEDSDHLTDYTHIPIIDQPSSSSQPKKKQPSKKAQRQEAEVPQDEAEHEDILDLQKAKDAQAKKIAALKKKIQRLERRKMSRPTGLKRLKKLLVIKKDEDIAIDAISLATKLLVIIDYKLDKKGMMVHYQLIRADGSSKRYSSMIRMLQAIDREDLEAL
ncbi:hypothetical protein Tco_1527848 [Tanacetum coccineum]